MTERERKLDVRRQLTVRQRHQEFEDGSRVLPPVLQEQPVKGFKQLSVYSLHACS